MSIEKENSPHRPRRIIVIGAGPNGLVTLRNLIERGDFERVELVERRDDIGGVWYLDDTDLRTGFFDPKPRWPSPAYPGLVGNVTPAFLSFSGAPFPPPPSTPHQPFPNVSQTHAYLRTFSKPYMDRIRLNTEVIRVEELSDGQGWKVTSRIWTEADAGRITEEIWDAVAICVGWFDHPVWPDTEGLDVLKKRGLAMHARSWSGPEGFEGKRVIVVGNANSGNDMTDKMAAVAKPPLYHSIRRPAFPGFPSLPDPRVVDVPPVKKYILHPAPVPSDDINARDKITAVLEDGTRIDEIDVILLGTGYRPNPGFIYVLPPTPEHRNLLSENEPTHIPLMSLLPAGAPQRNRIPNLYRHILYAHDPTLAFIGSALAATPFTVADLASTWLALAWLGLVTYPFTSTARLEFESARVAELEVHRSRMIEDAKQGKGPLPSSLMDVYNVLAGSEEAFAAELREDVVRAKPELADLLPVWSEESKKERESMYPAKLKALEWEREMKLNERKASSNHR